jgi:hypothetical protein
MTLDKEVATPQAIVEVAYELISFAPGAEPRWAAFRQLFADRCALALRVFPEDPSITVMNLDEYVRLQMREGMKEAGYEERPINRAFTITGDIAEARISFQMIFGNGEAREALDVFQMVRRAGRWWIVSIVSEVLAGSQASERA